MFRVWEAAWMPIFISASDQGHLQLLGWLGAGCSEPAVAHPNTSEIMASVCLLPLHLLIRVPFHQVKCVSKKVSGTLRKGMEIRKLMFYAQIFP